MKIEHKIIREMLKQMPVPEAKKILEMNLTKNEFISIFYSSDVLDEIDLNTIADTKLKCSESSVKKYRQQGYKKLASIFFPPK